MDSAKGSPPVGLDSAGRVAGDVRCRSCGYNLRGLSPEGRCPECGTAVGRSIRGDLLRYCDPRWVRQLARGVSWIIALILLAILPWLLLQFVGGVIVVTPRLLSSGFALVLVIVGTVIGVTETGSSRRLGFLLAVVGLALVGALGVFDVTPIGSLGLLAIGFGLVLAVLGMVIWATNVGPSRRLGLVLVIVGVVLAALRLLFGYTETPAHIRSALNSWVWRIGIPVIGLVGAWMVTAPEPDAAAAERRLSARKVARYMMVAWVAWILLIPFQVFLLLPIARTLGIGLPSMPIIPWRLLPDLQILEAAAYVALCIHMRKLALRVPNRSLARQTGIVMCPPALGVLGMIALYFASRGMSSEEAYGTVVTLAYLRMIVLLPLMAIFSIWIFVLLFLYRKAFRQAARFAKETWAAAAPPDTTERPNQDGRP